jgi:CheY-like chemotaxis protein
MVDAPDKTPTVLVVDDSPEIRQYIAKVIVPLGVNVAEASNGRQALSIIKKQTVDVVISDLIMPRMSGLMLLHSMLEQGCHVPFILVTGFSDKDSAIQALRLGAFDYLEKPVHETELQPVVQEALRVSREQRALAATPPQGVQVNANAELLIMKMRTFRFKGETFDNAITRDTTGQWHDLRDLFVQEAEPQLVFSESALRALAGAEQKARELGFVLRVVQAVRIAAEGIRLNDVAEFAWSIESTLAELKHHPEKLTPAHAQLLGDANAVLRAKVVALGDASARSAQQSLTELTAQLRSKAS